MKENEIDIAKFTYHMDRQIATAITKAGTESFLWDGLALISKNSVQYTNEPYVTGGNPILANDKILFNDMLGTTLGIQSDKYEPIQRDAFGMVAQDVSENFFTGKPYIGELGYAFLFRNYRAEQGKWLTQDLLGYPDGWNNFAYVNNQITHCIDLLGMNIYQVHDKEGAGGAGHSAWVAETTNNKYSVVDFNPKGGGIRKGEFSSLQEALNFLNQDNNRYESYLEFSTPKDHGDSFISEINKNIDNGYSLNDNNCYTVGAKAYNATNPDPYGTPLHTGNDPNYSYARNQQNGGIRHAIE